MTTTLNVMQQALAALVQIKEADTAKATPKMVIDARALYAPTIAALESAIAQPDLKPLVQTVHKAKGRYHSQIAMCDLYDACSLPNFRPAI